LKFTLPDLEKIPVNRIFISIVQQILLQGDPELAQITFAPGGLGLGFGFGERRQQQRRQNGDDGDDNKQLDEGETRQRAP
jgi:hypothetical protein